MRGKIKLVLTLQIKYRYQIVTGFWSENIIKESIQEIQNLLNQV